MPKADEWLWPRFTAEEADAASRVLLSNRVNYWTGEETRAFEREFAEWAGSRRAVALFNGTVALDLALQALGIGAGDEVIVTPRTFIASVSSVVNAGATPVFADVAPKWLDFVSDSVLVAHNAPFDTSFLNHEISRVYPGHRMVNPHLCTVRLSRRVLPHIANHRLDTIADHFSIPIVSRHRAGSDALATAEIFLLLLTELEETHGIKNLAAARRFQFTDDTEKNPI